MLRYSILILLVACDGGIAGPSGGGRDTSPVIEDEADISLSLTGIDFGSVEVGTTYQEFVTITNRGTTELVVKTISVEAPFTANPLTVTVQPGGSSQVTVSVAATDYSEFNADLVFASNDPDGDVSIPLHAIAITDADGDGHDRVESGGDDCYDNPDADLGGVAAANIYPGAPEIWYDGVDENCDGASDYDQDGDGWESDAFNPDAAAGGGDCQDSNSEYFPAADDVPYDNRDTNCDGADDFDYDGDGSRSDQYGEGRDCDDNDPNVNLTADEQLNGKDDDCDGEIDTSCDISTSEYVYVGKGSYDQAGYAVALGDLDNDGYAEVIVGGPYYNAGSASASGRGIVGIFQGGETLPASPGDVSDADRTIQGDGGTDGLGNYVTVIGDFDGDGENDLAMSAMNINSNGGAVYILGGSDALSGRDTGDAMYTMSGTSSQYLGRGVATMADLDGDGLDDLAAAFSSSGNAIAFTYGGASGSESSTGADATWTETSSGEGFYRNAPVGSDLDGDGYDDLLFADGTTDTPSTDAGSVWVVWGQPGRYSGTQAFTSFATTIGTGASSSDGFGTLAQTGGDMTGDGVDEVWVYENDTAIYAFAGGAYLRGVHLDTASALVTYEWEGSYTAALMRRGGDFSGDGVDDMFVGFEDTGTGAFLWLKSELTGSGWASKTDYGGYASGTSDNANGYLAYGMAPLGGDINGDGKADYVVGDPQKESAASTPTKEGEAYVLFNEHM